MISGVKLIVVSFIFLFLAIIGWIITDVTFTSIDTSANQTLDATTSDNIHNIFTGWRFAMSLSFLILFIIGFVKFVIERMYTQDNMGPYDRGGPYG